MNKSPQSLAREQRLAAKLKENLKRRKAQIRARSTNQEGEAPAKPDVKPKD